jgi:hypothetical protein
MYNKFLIMGRALVTSALWKKEDKSHWDLIYPWIYSLYGPRPLFQFLNPYTVSRTPWMGDQPAVRPLSTHRTTQNTE